jgi:mono/diheme cytochrome c family protein
VSVFARLSLLLVLAVEPLAAKAQVPSTTPSRADRGAHVLHEKCARCHTLSPQGASPLPAAPPFRDVYGRFAPRDLRAMLLEGMVSRHREMPQVELTEQDADAVMAFLYRLAGGR